MKYNEALIYLDENSKLKDKISQGFRIFIKNKNYSFSIEQSNDIIEPLKENSIVVTNDDTTYTFNMKSPLACAVFLEYGSSLVGQDLPEHPLKGAGFIQNLSDEICKPQINNKWYGSEFGQGFRDFVLFEYEDFFVENIDYVIRILTTYNQANPNERYLHIYLSSIISKCCYSAQQLSTIAKQLSLSEFTSKANEIIYNSFAYSEKRTLTLLKIAKTKNGKHLSLPSIIIGVSHYDFLKAFTEAEILLNSPSREIEGLSCLSRLS